MDITFDKFAETYYPNTEVDSFEYRYLENEFNTVSDIVGVMDVNKSYSKEELEELAFSDNRIKSQTTFYKRRRMLIRLMVIHGMDYLTINEAGKLEFKIDNSSSDFEKEYFGSEDEIIDTIREVSKINLEYNRKPALALSLLMWCGVDLVQCNDLKIADLNLESLLVKVGDGFVSITENTASAIKSHLADRTTYSEYLFSGRSGGKSHITTVNKMLAALNAAQDDKKFITKNIIYSGIFYRANEAGLSLEDKRKDVRIKYDNWKKIFRG